MERGRNGDIKILSLESLPRFIGGSGVGYLGEFHVQLYG